MDTLIGQALGQYQVVEKIGVGGMAVVYKAYQPSLTRYVAIKVLKQDFSQDNEFREKFRQEALAAANLSHPNIVTVHDFGWDSGKIFIVMEYIPGTDLKSILKQRGKMTIDEAIPLIVQACAGIGYAHRAGIVHCDVKPQNMLVTPDMRVKVTDFGIARALSSIKPDEQHDVVWGSPQYFSPEQASGAAPSPASDVYSLGVILYEMLTGHLPFQSNDPAELARLHKENRPASPRFYAPDLPPALEQIILKVLQKEPSARYRTADQLGRVLVTFSQQANHYSANIPPLNPIAANSKPLGNTTPNPPRPIVEASNFATSPQLSSQYNDPPLLNDEQTARYDWGTIGLALLATLVVGGLIPFWLYVGFSVFAK
ncbi:MAG: serine/threonine protein kinase [Anaerolineaceae bacterium]|nr:serine/threonine protein kinase [Anaerolineaceae bacterium]